MDKIPKITHQTWFQGWDQLPEKYHGYTESLKFLNPNWEHMKWDEESLRAECEKFSPGALAKFGGFETMIQKIDFGRCVVLHNYGGVSVDCDAECLKPLEKIPGFDRYELILSKNPLNRIENKVASFGLSKNLVMFNNATMCCSKEHSVIRHFIEFLIENESWNEDSVLDTQIKTGPLITSIFFNKYLDYSELNILDSEIFEPWGNVTTRTVLDHKCDQSWTGFVAYPVKLYGAIKNNLVILITLLFVIIAFFTIRKFLAVILKRYMHLLI
jgi:mannosyltransferase OCH1-like enzyme